jgi:hypothetical protein
MSKEDEIIKLLKGSDKKLALIIGNNIKEKHKLIKDQVGELRNCNMDYKEIALILGLSPKRASVEIARLKRKVKR